MVGQSLPGNRNECKAWEEAGAAAKTITIADGGYPGTGLVMPHRRLKGDGFHHGIRGIARLHNLDLAG